MDKDSSSVRSLSMPDSVWNLVFQVANKYNVKTSQAAVLLIRHGANNLLGAIDASSVKVEANLNVDYSKLAPLQESMK